MVIFQERYQGGCNGTDAKLSRLYPLQHHTSYMPASSTRCMLVRTDSFVAAVVISLLCIDNQSKVSKTKQIITYNLLLKFDQKKNLWSRSYIIFKRDNSKSHQKTFNSLGIETHLERFFFAFHILQALKFTMRITLQHLYI